MTYLTKVSFKRAHEEEKVRKSITTNNEEDVKAKAFLGLEEALIRDKKDKEDVCDSNVHGQVHCLVHISTFEADVHKSVQDYEKVQGQENTAAKEA